MHLNLLLHNLTKCDQVPNPSLGYSRDPWPCREPPLPDVKLKTYQTISWNNWNGTAEHNKYKLHYTYIWVWVLKLFFFTSMLPTIFKIVFFHHHSKIIFWKQRRFLLKSQHHFGARKEKRVGHHARCSLKHFESRIRSLTIHFKHLIL